VFFDHPLVMIRGQCCQALRKQVIVRIARLYLNHVSLLAQVIDGLNQQQLNAAVRSLGEPFKSRS
jgi:hypothetical protein